MSERLNFFEGQFNNENISEKEETDGSINEKVKEIKESRKQRQKYYFHGSFRQTLESVERDGFKL